jgi:hypothetical protein
MDAFTHFTNVENGLHFATPCPCRFIGLSTLQMERDISQNVLCTRFSNKLKPRTLHAWSLTI